MASIINHLRRKGENEREEEGTNINIPEKRRSKLQMVKYIALITLAVLVASLALSSPFFVLGSSFWVYGAIYKLAFTAFVGKILVITGCGGSGLAALGLSAIIISCIAINRIKTQPSEVATT